MKGDGKYVLCNVDELAYLIQYDINYGTAYKNYQGYDFSLSPEDIKPDEEQDLEHIANETEGWYGIHSVNTGFDSNDLILCCGVYGGGFCEIISVYDGIDDKELHSAIVKSVINAVDYYDCVKIGKNDILICEKRR